MRPAVLGIAVFCLLGFLSAIFPIVNTIMTTIALLVLLIGGGLTALVLIDLNRPIHREKTGKSP
ncbi:hypothetical protein [Qaidamihabitans albus]|uniref:hypothetical protein n=1 Tax=Qaidamihabitans albus TaxID=2795733 RepID=UPI0018F1F714|nr:hypothetical protein [Qaidamihabitans albus]